MSPKKTPFAEIYDQDVASAPLLGVEMITRERNRQIVTERWSTAHDDEHTDHSLAIVAACYAANGTPADVVVEDPNDQDNAVDAWPAGWDEKWDKRAKHPRIRQLAIAGALIAAEIDRLQRKAINDAEDALEFTPLPCPFCGSRAKVEEKDGQIAIGCTNDDCPVNPFKFASDRATAVEWWNRRAT